MKRISLFLIFLLCIAMMLTFVGCRSTKTTSKTTSKTEFKKDSVGESNQKVENKSVSATAGELNVKTKQSVLQDSTANHNATIRDYDTSKPIDPATGRPPLLRETIINDVVNKNTIVNSQTEKGFKFKNQNSTETKAEASAKAKVKQSGSNKATGNTETKIRSPVWPLSWRWSSAIVIALLLICDAAFNRAKIMLWLAKRIVGIFRRK